MTHPIVHYTMVKQPLTYSNYGKTGHAKETYQNRKRKKHVIPAVLKKVIKPIDEFIAQPIKPTRIPLRYMCIIYFSSKHHAPNCLRKIEVQTMFWIKPTTTTIIVAIFLKT
jgi:hypothetical protein